MQIGISSLAFSLERFTELVDDIEAEFGLWEVVMEGEHALGKIKCDLLDLRASSALEFSIHAPLSDLNIASLNPAVRRLSQRTIMNVIEFAAHAEILRVTFHPGRFSPLGLRKPDRVAELNRAAIARINDHAAQFGVVAAVENMPMPDYTLGNTAAEMVEMMGDSGIGLCLDIGHAHVSGELDNFIALADRIVNIHIHDNHGERDEHLALGAGTVPVEATVRALSDRYCGDIIIESRSLEDGIASKRVLDRILHEL